MFVDCLLVGTILQGWAY